MSWIWVITSDISEAEEWKPRIGAFSADARILFLMMHKEKIVKDLGSLSLLFVDLLP